MIETLVLTLFGLVLGLAVWWSWRQRRIAQEQAAMREQLATVGKTVDAVAHDLARLVDVLAVNLDALGDAGPDEAREISAESGGMARAVRNLLDAVRGQSALVPQRQGSTDGILRMAVALHKRVKAPIDARYEGDLLFDGTEVDALRVIQNLLANAVRETEKLPGGRIEVVLREGALTITNPVLDPKSLDDRIYEWGVSRSGSSGTGLAASRELAAHLGWTIRHEVQGSSVAFIVEATPAS